MRTRENAQTYHLDVLLDGDGHDVLDLLADSGVDHLEAGVSQSARDDLGATIVAVESGLCDENAGGHQNTTGCWNSPHTDLSADTISPTVQ